MPSTYQLEAQIKAITKKVMEGKAKNRYAAINKINSLKKQLQYIKQYNYLSI